MYQIVVRGGAIALIAFFWPQIMRFLRKIGYRSMGEEDDKK